MDSITFNYELIFHNGIKDRKSKSTVLQISYDHNDGRKIDL